MNTSNKQQADPETLSKDADMSKNASDQTQPAQQEHIDAEPVEYGGPKGLEPTRFGDWEKNGRCSDF